ncbi:MAG: SUMF1/EgtB/PvdO family nonheme iron enzyme, partial [Alloprevotella sp.]
MKTKLLLFFFCLSVLGSMGQGTISRHPKPQQEKPKQKPKKETPKPTPKPKPKPEAAGYDVTFTCNVSTANLSIDGTSYGAVAGTRFLKTGSHTIRLTAEGYENYSRTITVNRQNRSFHFAMTEKANQNLTVRVGDVSFVMVKVSGGTFTMGATSEMENPYDDEKPTHQVTLSSYYIGETEVTQALWKAVMGSNPSYFKGDNLPVEKVSWNDCQTFISKLNSLTGKR